MQEETIKKINQLYKTIGELKSFLSLIENSNVESSYSEKKNLKRNEFELLHVTSRIYTGSDNPRYDKRIEDRETINAIAETIKPILRARIAQLEAELQSFIK